ncbi:hypothetical protein K6Y31_20565 [Motilimonas cestriensis]|uniref:Uncharacterized protein n=1 Tax=Motilimonas cestriensis TaxID=2742685 RepID=A0ABS8WHD8_9GAMM|nr:hypothetical protein [Motilimonas cestriensis]MCE2597171.1 hypothetical protein [Motilimonas cestriensis]
MLATDYASLFSAEQKRVLNDTAHGQSTAKIAQNINATQADVRSIQLDIQARLDAKNTAHMIHRAWQVGLLGTKALCLLLAALTLQPQDNAIRTARTARTRTPSSLVRLKSGAVGRNLNA